MRHFSFYQYSEKYTVSGRILEFQIVEIVNNFPKILGQLEVCASSWKGAKSEVMNWLGEKGFLPTEISKGYYKFSTTPQEHNFTIYEI